MMRVSKEPWVEVKNTFEVHSVFFRAFIITSVVIHYPISTSRFFDCGLLFFIVLVDPHLNIFFNVGGLVTNDKMY